MQARLQQHLRNHPPTEEQQQLDGGAGNEGQQRPGSSSSSSSSPTQQQEQPSSLELDDGQGRVATLRQQLRLASALRRVLERRHADLSDGLSHLRVAHAPAGDALRDEAAEAARRERRAAERVRAVVSDVRVAPWLELADVALAGGGDSDTWARPGDDGGGRAAAEELRQAEDQVGAPRGVGEEAVQASAGAGGREDAGLGGEAGREEEEEERGEAGGRGAMPPPWEGDPLVGLLVARTPGAGLAKEEDEEGLDGSGQEREASGQEGAARAQWSDALLLDRWAVRQVLLHSPHAPLREAVAQQGLARRARVALQLWTEQWRLRWACARICSNASAGPPPSFRGQHHSMQRHASQPHAPACAEARPTEGHRSARGRRGACPFP